jgi:microcystin degradation protein MlrC
MRFVIGMMKHETNTFSPVPTPLASFQQEADIFEPRAQAFQGTNTALAAFIDLARKEGAEIVTPVAASAWPSGPVDADAYRAISEAICRAVAKGCDALFLDLHGAMVSQETDDGEGTLLQRIRRIAPNLPIAVALDLHANITEEMVANCTAIAGYQTYPHVDMYETGKKAGQIIIEVLHRKVSPAMAWMSCPMIPHTLRMGTSEPPMSNLVAAARAEERNALAVSVFGGFPLADIAQAGLSVVAVTDGDRDRAEQICRTMSREAWRLRKEFIYRGEPLAQSVSRAVRTKEWPVLLIDHADNCASGGTQDTMAVVAEVIRQGLDNVAVGSIRDPEAVAAMIQAGVGKKITLPLGGKMDMPSIGRKGEPLEVTGRVRVISDGRFVPRGPMLTGVAQDMGRSVVLDAGPLEFVVSEKNHEPFDLGIFRSLGIEPTAKRYLLLKSRIHYRAGFLPIAKTIVECNGVGVTGSDYTQFKFIKLRRPIFPLEQNTEF